MIEEWMGGTHGARGSVSRIRDTFVGRKRGPIKEIILWYLYSRSDLFIGSKSLLLVGRILSEVPDEKPHRNPLTHGLSVTLGKDHPARDPQHH